MITYGFDEEQEDAIKAAVSMMKFQAMGADETIQSLEKRLKMAKGEATEFVISSRINALRKIAEERRRFAATLEAMVVTEKM